MKNLSTLFLAIFFLVSTSIALFGQESVHDSRVWSVLPKVTGNPIKQEIPQWVPPQQVTRFYDLSNGDAATVGPNYRVKPGNTTQSEMSIDVHPTNSNIVFGSANATNWPVSTLYGTGVYWSLDGGANWTGYDNPPFGGNSGDPASVIGSDGRFYENYINNSYGLSVSVSTNNGTNWSTYSVTPNPGSVADKNHFMVDKTPTSPYVNRSYCVWTEFGGSLDGEVALRYSTDFGATWSAKVNISGTLTPLASAFGQGANVQTGPNGEVYVTYVIYDANWTDGEDAIGFSKSTDGGTTWTHLRAYNQVNFGVRGNLSSKNGIRVSSFPSMSVDRSGGPHNGTIYITWTQRAGVAPAGNSPDIVLIKSTDGGATWSAPVRVNDDPINNGKDQYYSWCSVDQVTGRLVILFYDSRDVPNNQAEVYMATSTDGGNAFENFKVSDQPHTPTPINGLAGGYAGDYIGVVILDDICYPFWADNRLGSDHYQAWTASVTFGPPCPIDPPANPNPSNGTTNVNITGNSISWTNGVGSNQLEVWFGQMGSMVQVYSGSLITSWSLAPYEPFGYNKTYGWQIKEKNDTCTVSGPVWTFTTMQDPNLVIDTVIVYPSNAQYWTGNTSGSTKVDGEINTVYPNNGWAVFDISSIPGNTTAIDSIQFYGYVNATNWPYWSATPMGTVDPLTASASAIYNQINNNTGQGTAYVYSNESSSFSTGWHNYTFEASAESDLLAAIPTGKFAVGFIDRDGVATYYINFDGHTQAHPPYLWIVYEYSVPVELTSFAASVNKTEVTLNWRTATETNNQGFDIERMSANGQFEKIGFVAGFGTTTEPKSYTFVDSKLEPGNYVYRLKQVDFDGTYEYSSEVNAEVTLPLEYSLEQNYPNPFNPSTTIKYSVAEDGFVKLSVYNMLGEEVANLVNTQQKAGRYEISFNAANLASGVYVYRLEAPNFTSSKKLMLMK
jgi:hypothetical protein